MSNMQLEAALACVEGLSLIEYIEAQPRQRQGNMSAAIDSIEAFTAELEARGLGQSSHHEQLLQLAAQLLYDSATHG